MDSDALVGHLRRAPDYVARWRSLMVPGPTGTRPPGGGTSTPAPCALWAMDGADAEAAAVGRLATAAMNAGAMPPIPIRGMWWSRGRCMGLAPVDDDAGFTLDGDDTRADPLQRFRALCRDMEPWAATMVRYPALWPHMDRCERVRHRSRARFPAEERVWLSMGMVTKKYGIKQRHIYALAEAGVITMLKDDYGPPQVLESDVKAHQENVKGVKSERMRKALEARGIKRPGH